MCNLWSEKAYPLFRYYIRGCSFVLTTLHDEKLARKSVARKVSSLRSLYRFLMREGYRKDNPFALRHSPKELSIPKFLYAEELEELFEVSDTEPR